MRLPVIVAPMFLISGPDLVIAAGKAGIIGAFPAPNARTVDVLDDWLAQITTELSAAGRGGMWAINMIVHATYERFDAELDLICRYQPDIVITALGSPARPLDRVHGYGGRVFSDVITPLQAKKAIDAGADGLILVAAGAGGHTGLYSPFALVDEVRGFWDGPIVLGGGIGNARGIAAAQMLGADFAYMGTRFIATPESLVSDDNRAMLVRARLSDIVTTAAITGVASNWRHQGVEKRVGRRSQRRADALGANGGGNRRRTAARLHRINRPFRAADQGSALCNMISSPTPARPPIMSTPPAGRSIGGYSGTRRFISRS